MTAQRGEEQRNFLPKLSQGSLVSGNILKDTKRSEKRKKKKSIYGQLDVSESPHSKKIPALRKDNDQLLPKLPSLGIPGQVATSPEKEIKLSKFEKLPQLNTTRKLLHMNSDRKLPRIQDDRQIPEVKNRRRFPQRNDPDSSTQAKYEDIRKKANKSLEKGRFTAFEETGSDASSTLSRHQAKTVQDQSRLKRRRDVANMSRDYLLTLMPPKNAKCYTFSQGMVSGAQQELIRMRTLMGRDKLSSERSHVDAVIAESRRRAASINALMTGNKTNTTNNSIPGMRKPENGSDVPGVGRVTFHKSRRKMGSERHPFSSVLKSDNCFKSEAVMAFMRAFRSKETSVRRLNEKYEKYCWPHMRR